MICRRLSPVAVRLAANARVRGPQGVRMWAITHSALLARTMILLGLPPDWELRPGSTAHSRCERPFAHSYAEVCISIRDQQCSERYVAERWYPPSAWARSPTMYGL